MTVGRFETCVKLAKIHDNDRTGFGLWVRRYAVFIKKDKRGGSL
jgi:hypothetical protein